jgi:hypothetical protein
MKPQDTNRSRTPSEQTTKQSILRVDLSAGRWKAIPMALINDERLGLDTRGFAAWLLARSDGWRILASALPRLLTSQVEQVGRDKTRRFLRELEAAGYLVRTRRRAVDGRWIWDICFYPTSMSERTTSATMDGLAVDGSTVGGSAAGGKPVDIPQILIRSDAENSISKRPTTTAAPETDKAVVGDLEGIRFPEFLSGSQLASVKKLMARCSQDDAQAVLDEVGAMVAQRVVRHPMGLLGDLVQKASQGRFIPNRSLGRGKSRAPSSEQKVRRFAGESRAEPTPDTKAAADVAKQALSHLKSRFDAKPP